MSHEIGPMHHVIRRQGKGHQEARKKPQDSTNELAALFIDGWLNTEIG